MKIVNPTNSYNLLLPDDVKEEYDKTVASFWREGNDLLLQLSSHQREKGNQVEASERLKAKIESIGGEWKRYGLSLKENERFQTAGSFTKDENGTVWLHMYITWPDLMIYATISGKSEGEVIKDNWAIDAVQKIKRVFLSNKNPV